MSIKKFALMGGSVMVLMGLFALVPASMVYSNDLPGLYVDSGYGYFLGVFPMNILNKLALLFFGTVGIACGSTGSLSDMRASIIWSRVVLFTMGSLAILGMFPQTNTLGGYWPLFGNEVWFHAVFAVMGGYFGFIAYHVPHQHGRTDMHRV